MSVMFDPRCGPSEATYTNVDGVIACYHYLNSLSTTRCGIPGSGSVTEFCRSGNAHAVGQSLTGRDESSSWYAYANPTLYDDLRTKLD